MQSVKVEITPPKRGQPDQRVEFPHSEGEVSVLDVQNMTVVRSGRVIIRDIDLKINKGEFVGLVGPNGSGKSTLLLAILGVLKSKTGTVSIYGHPPMSRKLNGKIGWVSQAASNLPRDIRITVRELVQLGTRNASNMFFWTNSKQKELVDKAIKMVGLENVENTDIARLSGGQRQRAVIARALASDAEFILLDEPLVGIDRESRNSLLKLLDLLCHDEGKTILMVSHDLTAIRQTAHRMIFLEEAIRFDGNTNDFPDLNTLAKLRGIEPVHSSGDSNEHNHSKEEE
ncbi:MAG: metal ABC transporter ATP-binding protein [Euryarchaeota archaeon]|jgi:zinc transport system ATP-binding protein|nr:metal ABC transporter ATP-binding protein [Euryarchaeota archaeon]MBT7244661.1 metal ABC transporter ATP-binding protein [Euryarchaeota archaeon]